MRGLGRWLALAALCGAWTAARADDPPARAEAPPPASDEIVVTGARESTLDLKRLLKARAAFEAGRATFAPTSTLYFQLRPAAGAALAGMTLSLRGGDRTIPVAIDGEGRFRLPDVPQGTWELVHNRGRSRIAVRALVLSQGANETDRPLGDLRLQCRVAWELKQADYSLIARAGFSAVGGCGSSRIMFYFQSIKPIVAAAVTENGATRDLPIRGDAHGFLAPLSDKALSNAAKIRVRYD